MDLSTHGEVEKRGQVLEVLIEGLELDDEVNSASHRAGLTDGMLEVEEATVMGPTVLHQVQQVLNGLGQVIIIGFSHPDR